MKLESIRFVERPSITAIISIIVLHGIMKVQHAIIEYDPDFVDIKIWGLNENQKDVLKQYPFGFEERPDFYIFKKTHFTMARILDHLLNSLGFEFVTVMTNNTNNNIKTFILKKTVNSETELKY